MAQHYEVVKGIDWKQVCPPIVLTRCFRVGISISVLLLTTLGVCLTGAGWNVSDWAFAPSSERAVPAIDLTTTQSVTDDSASVWETLADGQGVGWVGNKICGYLQEEHLADGQITGKRALAKCIVDFFWLLLVWSYVGGIITRIAVVRIGRGERVSLREACCFVRRKYVSYLMSPLFIMVSCAVISLPMLLIGLLLNFDVGVVLAAILWLIVMIAGISIAVLLTGLFFGWPLMWPAISAEEAGDVYEATSRSFAYTFQAPIQYLFYVLIALAIWMPGVVIVQNFTAFAEQIIFSIAGVSGGESLTGIQHYLQQGRWDSGEPSGTFTAGANIIFGLHWLGHAMADAFCIAFFFCSSAGVYLMLRRFVDQTEIDEVYVIDEKTKYGLADLIRENEPEADASEEV